MRQVAVVIPVYRQDIEADERVSLLQSFHMLRKYPIVLVCPDGLNTYEYERLAVLERVELIIERFDYLFFEGVSGYNRLLLSECFYRRFWAYKFILICQLDVYIFKDELEKWCEKEYDFIGAPLFGLFSDVEFHDEEARVGNGGFSLRRTQAYLDYFNGEKHVFRKIDIARRISFWKKPYTRWLVWFLMMLGWRNRPRVVAEHWKYNEDDFWSGVLDGSNYALRKPDISEALLFSFERFPSECYAITGQLPFGCHAWKKYQFETFWSHFIHEKED